MTANQIAEVVIIVAGIGNILLIRWIRWSRRQMRVVRGGLYPHNYRMGSQERSTSEWPTRRKEHLFRAQYRRVNSFKQNHKRPGPVSTGPAFKKNYRL